MRRPSLLVLTLLLPALPAAACGGVARLEAVGRAAPAAPGQEAQALHIYTRDPNLPELLFDNSATLTASSADEVRVRVTTVHSLEVMADPAGWDVWLEDEAGRRVAPAAAEGTHERLAVRWRKVRSELDPDRYTAERVIPGWDVYRGQAEYVFAAPGLGARPQVTLVARKDGVELRYTWHFGEGAPAPRHHGPLPANHPERIVVPGPLVDVGS
jgi:hypothetical protein